MTSYTKAQNSGFLQGNFAGVFGLVLKGLKLFKSTKVIFAASSFATYAFLFSWQFAAVIIVTLVFHEYGHLWAMHRFGMKTKGIYLIPFVGGAAVSEEAFRSRWEEVYVAAMGPTFGLGLCCLFLAGYFVTDIQVLALMATYGALVNAFNLLPISPLDGGRIMKCLAFSANHWWGFLLFVIGALIGVWGLFVAQIWLFGFILMISLLDFWGEWRRHRREKAIQSLTEYYDSLLDVRQKIQQNVVINLPEELQQQSQIESREQAEAALNKEIEDVAEILSRVGRLKLVPDLNARHVLSSIFWYIAIAAGLFGIIVGVAYLQIPGGDLPALLINN